ncbi:MAG TPA: L-arabinose isomerase [Anaerolineae bacterium]|nr:L-arabinose isomerase [Anaerolineae bacterium]
MSEKLFNPLEVWFIVGSQHLYGPEALEQVAADARQVAAALDESPQIPIKVQFRPIVTTPDEIHRTCIEANSAENCVGLIAWMHTFSPARMWIAGLTQLKKPLLQLHTQFNRDIPWDTIDMDYMNLHQTAHGGREFGFIGARLRMPRKVVVGHWQDKATLAGIDVWARAASAWHDLHGAKIARFGDNMREVAVTEGNKVSAQVEFGFAVNGYGVGDLVEHVNAASAKQIDDIIAEYKDAYVVAHDLSADGKMHYALRDAAAIEVGLRSFLTDGGFKGFTTTFENLHGLKQLPGLAVQRLMADGYGFGAEGDWKTAALLRAMKVMDQGLAGGTSFMEDYTYHFDPNGMKVLGAHMLEICPSIANGRPTLEVHPLGIGGKADPVRLVFDAPAGPGLNASLIDLGDRFRLLVNTVETVAPDAPLPRLPVARALWKPHPDLKIAAAAWILAGGAHHTGFSQALTVEHLQDFAEMAKTEFVLIDEQTTLFDFKKELRWNDLYYHMTALSGW